MMLAFSMMSPAFAIAGLIAIGFPLWMHLYQRVASRRVPISSLRLVPELPRVARSRRRIQYWPLFLLRALGVVLLGLAFSRPSLPMEGAQEEGGREAVVIVLDRSGSMAMRSVGQESAWEEAVEKVDARLKGLHPQSRVRLIGYPSISIDSGEDWQSPSAARETLQGISATQEEGLPFDAVEEASKVLARFRSDMPESLEIYSDLQKKGWDDISTLTLPGELRVEVIQVGEPAAINRGLALHVRGRDQLRRAAIMTEGEPMPLEVETVPIEGGEPVRTEIPFPDEVVELAYRSEVIGWNRREVNYQESNDGLPLDDVLFDVFYVTPEIRVYLLEPESEKEAFLQTTFFISQALRPTIGEAAQDSRFLPEVLPLADSEKILGQLDSSRSIVVIPALESWPPGLPKILEELVSSGGAVVFFSGPEIRPEAYAESWGSLLPAMPGGVLEVDRSLTLPPISEDHLIWGGLPQAVRRDLRRLAIEKRFDLVEGQGSEIVARYSDGISMIVSKNVGEGKALFFNASVDRSWGDWPTNGALYVPTVHGVMSVALETEAQRLRNSAGSGIVGVPFDVRVASKYAGSTLLAGDEKWASDEEGWVRGLQFDQVGFYEMKTSNGELVRPVAVNFPPVESEREMLLPTVLERQIEGRRRMAEGQAEEAPEISMANESMWWRWVLVALAVAWLLEPFLAFRPSDLRPIEKGTAS